MSEKKKLIRYEDVYRYAFKGVHGGGLEDEDFSAIINAIDAVEAVDAVEVIRCKVCKHAKINENHPNKPLLCFMTKMCGTVEPEWFCADGERREGE